jgi:hypothetical protein
VRETTQGTQIPSANKKEEEVNNFLILVNGVLAPPGIADIRKLNSADKGSFVRASIDVEKLNGKKLGYFDVLEVRASNIVRRYHTSEFAEPKDGKVHADCFGVDNIF